MTIVESEKTTADLWWISIAAGVAWLSLFVTPWSFVLVAGVIGFAIYRLTRSPRRAEKIVLWIVLAVLVATILLLVAIAVITFGLEAAVQQTAVVIDN